MHCAPASRVSSLRVVGIHRRVGEYFHVRAVSEAGFEAVDVGADDVGDGLAVVQSDPGKDPNGGVDDVQRG